MTATDSGPSGLEPTLLGLPIPAAFPRAVYVVAPGARLRCDEVGWSDGVAIIQRGQVELETAGGARLWLGEDDMFTLAHLGPVHISNVEPGPALITVVGRRATNHSEPPAGRPSQR